MKQILLSATAVLALSGVAHSNEYAPAMQEYLESNLRSWAQSAVIVDAIKSQNTQTAAYDQAMIDTLDLNWRTETTMVDTPTITPVLTHAAADFLRQQVAKSGGQLTEIILMDQHGLNVAASDVTSDYWQGDEAKFTQTFGISPTAYHLGDVTMDDSTGEYQGQISLTITDPATGEAIGAMTVGVNVDALL